MGTNVYLLRSDLSEVEGWDSSGLAGGRDLAEAALHLLSECVIAPADCYRGDIILQRPADFAEWRNFVRSLDNPDHWACLLDRVEADSDLWIWFSR